MSLHTILTDLLQQAELAPTATFRQTLSHGLTIEIQAAELEYFLALSRADTWPSTTELQTVMNAWPGQRPHGIATKIRDKGRYCLATVIDRPPQTENAQA